MIHSPYAPRDARFAPRVTWRSLGQAPIPCQGPVVLPPGYLSSAVPAPLTMPSYGPSSPIEGSAAEVPPGGRPPGPRTDAPPGGKPPVPKVQTTVKLSPRTNTSLFVVGAVLTGAVGLWFFRDQIWPSGK